MYVHPSALCSIDLRRNGSDRSIVSDNAIQTRNACSFSKSGLCTLTDVLGVPATETVSAVPLPEATACELVRQPTCACKGRCPRPPSSNLRGMNGKGASDIPEYEYLVGSHIFVDGVLTVQRQKRP